jgi:hypothetical protein
MSCLATGLLGLFSRLAIIYWWFVNPQSHNLPFKGWNLPGIQAFADWVWVVLGCIFLPWTTLAYLILYPGGILDTEWVVLGIAILFDLVGHGGIFYHRNRYRRNQSLL